ncbi:MAG: DUF2232 domain-containing protein [Candidatus Latescibacterota bacterium]
MGFLAGMLFAFLAGEFDPARYLVEQLTLIPFEVLFVTAAVYVTVKNGTGAGLAYCVSGVLGSYVFLYPAMSLTSAVFLKTAATGVLIGESRRFGTRFVGKLAVAAVPGFILAGVAGLPIVYNGVSPDVIEVIKQEALSMYKMFMPPDDAMNAAENALALMKGMFGAGFAILALASVVVSWLSFLLSGWMLRRRGRETETVPPLSEFALPFPVMWVFLASFALALAEPKIVYPAALNLLIITAGLYGVQGVAVILHFMNRASMGRFPRVLFWLIFFITLAFSGVFFVFTGIIDNWFHIRTVFSAPGAAGNKEENDHEGDFKGRR